jgi:prepilin-type N-terminal cleavage/methylation domain-containing protein
VQRGAALGLAAGCGVLMNRARKHVRASQDGFTIIEVLAAILLVGVGVLFAIGSLVSSTHATAGAQAREAAVGFADQQIENLRQQPFSSLAMSAAPSHDAGVNSPDFFTVGAPGTCYQIETSYQTGGTPLACEGFVVQPGGTVPAGPQPISGYPGWSYEVYVTGHQETSTGNGCVSISAVSYCPTGADETRITVAVSPPATSSTGGAWSSTPHKPIWVSAIITNPNPAAVKLP